MPTPVRKRPDRAPPPASGPSLDQETVARMELANRVFFRLYQCANMLHKTGTRAVESDGLTTQRWAVLGALSRAAADNGMTVGELARYLMVSRQSLAGLIGRMARDGHLTTTQDRSDLRSRRVALTHSGRKLWLVRARPSIQTYYEHALAGFSIGDLSDTLHYLLKLLDNMQRLDAGEAAPASTVQSQRGGASVRTAVRRGVPG